MMPQPIAGERGAAFVDPASGNVALPAMTCSRAGCAGHEQHDPFLFVVRGPHFQIVGDRVLFDIKEDAPTINQEAPSCPVCGQKSVVRYLPPESAQLQASLEQALKDARSGSGSAGEHTPREIMQDMSNLPQLYLIEP